MVEFDIHMWTPPPRRSSLRDQHIEDPVRKAARFRRPDNSDAAALKAWRRTDIPVGTQSWEIARWLWDAGERVCPLCERDIDITITAKQHPGKPEVDHYLAKVLGGPNTWGNVRVTHATCNRFRGAPYNPEVTWLPQQYRRAYDRAMKAYSAPDREEGKSIQHFEARVDSSLREIEFLELALAAPDEPQATRWINRALVEGGPARIQQAIDYHRREMERSEAMLREMERYFAWRAAKRAEKAASA